MDACPFDYNASPLDMQIAAVEWGLVGLHDDWLNEYANGCGECGCCPCMVPGCPDCPTAAPDTGPYGFDVPVVHGIAGARATVTADIRRDRHRLGNTRAIRDTKREAHRRHRRAWRRWLHVGAPDERLPTPRPGTGWEVW